MYRSAVALLDCSYVTLHFAHVHVGCDNVQDDWNDLFANTFEFHISVNVDDDKTSGTVQAGSRNYSFVVAHVGLVDKKKCP
jgi:hypothetical protein